MELETKKTADLVSLAWREGLDVRPAAQQVGSGGHLINVSNRRCESNVPQISAKTLKLSLFFVLRISRGSKLSKSNIIHPSEESGLLLVTVTFPTPGTTG